MDQWEESCGHPREVGMIEGSMQMSEEERRLKETKIKKVSDIGEKFIDIENLEFEG